MKRTFAAVIMMAFGAAALLWPRLIAQLSSNSDGKFFIVSAQQFIEALTGGTILPRWAPGLFGGLGAPVFLIYPPAWFLLVGGIGSLVGDMATGAHLVELISAVLMGSMTFAFLARFQLPPLSSVTIALLAAFTPFSYATLLFVEGLPWNLAYVFSLGLMLIVVLLPPVTARTFGAVALLTAALALTHLLMTLMTAVALLAVGSAHLVAARQDKTMRPTLAILVMYASAAGIGVLMAGFHLWPAVQEVQHTSEHVFATDVDWRTGFAFPFYTGSEFGARWKFFNWGLATALLGTLSFSTLVLALNGDASPRVRSAMTAALAAGWFALLVSSDLSYPLWERIALLRKVQYAYRFFSVGFMASVIALGLSFVVLRQPRSVTSKALRVAAIAICAMHVLLLVAIQFQFASSMARPITQAGLYGYGPFAPKTAGPDWRAFAREGGFEAECQRADAVCRTVRDESEFRQWRIETARPVEILLPAFASPWWRLTVHGRPTSQAIDQTTGAIRIAVPAGGADVALTWVTPTSEISGRWGSVVGVLLLSGALALVRRFQRSPKPNDLR